jgi:hypothetical protein
MSPPGSKLRRKLAVILQSLVDFEEIIPNESLQPSSENFKGIRTRTPKLDYTFVKIKPKLNIVNASKDLEILEFLTRNLFIHTASRWVDTLK